MLFRIKGYSNIGYDLRNFGRAIVVALGNRFSPRLFMALADKLALNNWKRSSGDESPSDNLDLSSHHLMPSHHNRSINLMNTLIISNL